MSWKRLCFSLLSGAGILLPMAGHAAGAEGLKVEQRAEPCGIDVRQPHFSWLVTSNRQNEMQTAYQVEVSQGGNTVWDSGRVAGDRSVAVLYTGAALQPQARYGWRVRVWDRDGVGGDWSAPAVFVTGVLGAPWQGKWITGEPVAVVKVSKGFGYHAGETTKDEVKWVQVDLGRTLPVEAVVLESLRHADRDGFGFPLRYRVEGADSADFAKPVLIADCTQADAPNPGKGAVTHRAAVTARHVRVTAVKLYSWNGHFCFALSELQVISGGKNVALDRPVSGKDSVEGFGWCRDALTDGVGSGKPKEPEARGGMPVFRREIMVGKPVREAVVSVCGLGQYELFLNGKKVGDDLLTPGWTNYKKACLYDTYDVTGRLQSGGNQLRVMLGNGFFNIPGGRYTKLRGSFGQPMLTLQLRVRYADGTEELFTSDGSWQTAHGPVTFSCVYGGEDYDARVEAELERPEAWKAATIATGPGGVLAGLSHAAAPIRAIESIKPLSVKKLSDALYLYDFGQNVSFMPRLTVRGPAGATVRMIPSELAGKDGRIQDPMCGGKAYYTYTLKGVAAGEAWFPQFFYRGGRYMQVELKAPEGQKLPEVVSLESVIVHSAVAAAGDFACSNELFNRIRLLIRWAQRSNLMSVITDCPHREKLGWLEQYHLHGYALRYEWDMAALYAKGMGDMAQAQLDNGLVPDIAPEYTVFNGGFRDSPEWGASFVIVPWQQYEFTGDAALLATYYDGMRRYCDYLQSKSKELIVSHGLGDWYDIGPKSPGVAQLTPRELTATAYFYHCADIIARTAALLGKPEDAQKYGDLARRIRDAFNRKFWREDAGVFSTGSQCANAMPLVMGIAEPRMRERALAAIVKDVQAKNLTAGDVGYHYLLRALYEGGRSDVIYALNNQSDKPGYGYQLKKGATALTEAWDAGTGSSHNHFMLGHITEWLYAGLAGIQPDPAAPGWKKFIIRPAVVGDLTWVKAHYDSPYGRIVSHWTRDGKNIVMDVTIPPNTTATIFVPGEASRQAGSGCYQFKAILP